MALPSGYTQLEYIQASGTQYIDTGFAPNQDSRVVIDFQVLDTHSGEGHICSVRDTTSGPYLIMLCQTSLSNYYRARVGTAAIADVTSLGQSRERMVWDFDKNVLKVNGTAAVTFAAQTYTMTNTLPVFCRKTGSEAGNFIHARVYSCQIYDNGTLVRDFVPAQRNSDHVVGLYDTVNGVFYTNAGTGVFSYPGYVEPAGTHNTLIDGTAYAITGGKVMVGGTVYDIGEGKTLVDGTVYEIAFAPSVVTVKITGTGSTASVCPAYVVINGQTYASAATLELQPGTTVTAHAKYSSMAKSGGVFLNGTKVSDQDYEYEVSGNVTIALAYSVGEFASSRNGTVDITEE